MTDTRFDGRLRYLLSDPRKEKICLDDVIEAFAAVSEKARHLEYKNTSSALTETNKAVKAAEKKLIEFKLRIKNEVTEEVAEFKSNNPGVFNTKKEE